MEMPQVKTDSESTQSDDALSTWVAERLVELMAEHGVPPRQQANLLGDLCGLSLSQARRKLRGAMWSFNEVLVVARHFGVSIDQLFSDFAHFGVINDAIASGASAPMLQEATFLMDELAVPCQIRLGALVVGTPGDDELLTAQNQEGWYVGTKKQLDRHCIMGARYLTSQVLLTPSTAKPRIRIAILDDDVGTSETLGEWFNAADYAAMAFTSGDQLLASKVENFDAFVVDFMLAGGDSSLAIIKIIRQALPEAPIVLLTGKLRDGQASEAELSAMLRTSNVTFFEKPVRPSILAAAIEKELDQVATKRI